MQNHYNIAIIGSGPAGMSAAINAAIRNKKVIMLGPKFLSEKLIKTKHVNNYLGIENVTGQELLDKFYSHIKKFKNIDHVEGFVEGVYIMPENFNILTRNNEVFTAQKVILATGVHLGSSVKGEDEFLGRGVGTCATCDAALYHGKKVVVVGYNLESVEEANFISEVASSTVFINMIGREVELREGIEVIKERPIEILGDTKARKILTNKREIEADGFFFIKDAVKASQLVPGLEASEHVEVDRNFQTKYSGLYAVGDLTGKPYQINKACGEAQVAALHASSN